MDYRSLKLLIEQFLLEDAAPLQTLNRTYGVEFEMIFNRTKLDKFIEENKELFPTEEDVKDFHLGNAGPWDEILPKFGFQNWRVHYDGSIKPAINTQTGKPDLGVEIVTGILSGTSGLDQIKQFLLFARKLGGYVNDSCGGHVHIGAKDLLEGSEKQVTNRFILGLLTAKKFQPLLQSMIPANRAEGAAKYAKRVETDPYTMQSALARASENKSTRNHLIDLVDEFAEDRYRSINFRALREKGTIEFRIFDGTLSYQTIVERIKFATSFVNLLAVVETDIVAELKNLRKQHLQTLKQNKSKDLKFILQDIYQLNKEEYEDAITIVNGFKNVPMAMKQKLLLPFINYPLYKKATDLSGHFIAIEFKNNQQAEYAKNVFQDNPYWMNKTKIIDNVLEVPAVTSQQYEQKIGDLFANKINLDQFGISPEEFLEKLDVEEAEPYKIDFSEYKRTEEKLKNILKSR